MMGSAAFADVTAPDIWADWKGYLEGSGYSVTADESQSGNTLSVSNITLGIAIVVDDPDMIVSIGDMTFVETGDGTVSVEIPPEMTMDVEMDGPGDEDFAARIDYLTTGFEMIASGDPNAVTYDYSSDGSVMQLGDITAAGQTIDLGTFKVSVADLAGQTQMKVGNIREAEQTLSSGAVTYNIDFADPENPDARIVLNGAMAGLEATGTSLLPLQMDAADVAGALAEGFSVDANLAYRDNAMDFEFTEAGQTTQGSTSSATGAVVVKMSESGLLYDVSTTQTNVAMAGGEIPLPVEFALEESGFNLTMPISEGDAEQDFALGFKMGNFTMSDLLWGLFDPSGQLPRDPATIDIDLTGKAKLFFDLMDPEAMVDAETSGETPGELNALDVNLSLIHI